MPPISFSEQPNLQFMQTVQKQFTNWKQILQIMCNQFPLKNYRKNFTVNLNNLVCVKTLMGNTFSTSFKGTFVLLWRDFLITVYKRMQSIFCFELVEGEVSKVKWVNYSLYMCLNIFCILSFPAVLINFP
jgi:hypothetical protein